MKINPTRAHYVGGAPRIFNNPVSASFVIDREYYEKIRAYVKGKPGMKISDFFRNAVMYQAMERGIL